MKYARSLTTALLRAAFCLGGPARPARGQSQKDAPHARAPEFSEADPVSILIYTHSLRAFNAATP